MRFVLATLLCAAWLSPPAAFAQKKKAADEKQPAKKVQKKSAPDAPLPFKTFEHNFSYAYGMFTGQQIYSLMTQRLRPGFANVDRKKLAAAIEPGKELGERLKKGGLDIDDKKLKAGFEAALSGAKAKVSETQMKELFDEANKRLLAHRKKQGEKNKKDGQAFLEANKKKEGVKTTKSGLQYKVLKEGKGKIPKAGDLVVTHYHGTHIDGTVFDSSVERKEPATFRVGGVIKGWQEALQLMKTGSKWKIFVPAELAYREEGKGDIGPHAVLIFELELLDIKNSPKFDPRRFKP